MQEAYMIAGIPILLVLAWLVIGALVTFIVAVAVVVWVTAAALDVLVNCRPWRKRNDGWNELLPYPRPEPEESWICTDPECPLCYPERETHA
jgi:hypothetical protein